MPGMGFKRTAKSWNEQMLRFIDVPYEFVRRQLVRLNFILVLLPSYSTTSFITLSGKWNCTPFIRG